jgi:hypothetical protein
VPRDSSNGTEHSHVASVHSLFAPAQRNLPRESGYCESYITIFPSSQARILSAGDGVADGLSSVAVGDLDGDGDIDLAVANHVSDNVSVQLNPCVP